MHPKNLRTFLQLLEQADQLTRVQALVDPKLELATIVDKVGSGAHPGKALLFEQVRGSRAAVAVNLFGTLQRVAWALGTTDLAAKAEELARALAATGQREPELGLLDLCAAPQYQPVLSGEAPCRECDHSAQGLGFLPQIQAWPGDSGGSLTLAEVITRRPDGDAQNCGIYRVQPVDDRRAAINCRPGSGMHRHLLAWHAAGEPMPVAIVLGGPPVLTWAAAAPLPESVDELAFCGALTGQPLPVIRSAAGGLLVPAAAEIVIEGEVAPGAVASAGTFGNHTGSYVSGGMAPLLAVSRVTARAGAICPWTLVGAPPRENIQLARGSEILLLPLVRMQVPTVRGLYLPDEGIFHRAALVTVEAGEQRPLRPLAQALRETVLLNNSRLLVIGAADHDPHDPAAVFWRVLNRVEWQRDLLVEDGLLTIDARRLPPGGPVRPDPAVLRAVLDRWPEYRVDPGRS